MSHWNSKLPRARVIFIRMFGLFLAMVLLFGFQLYSHVAKGVFRDESIPPELSGDFIVSTNAFVSAATKKASPFRSRHSLNHVEEMTEEQRAINERVRMRNALHKRIPPINTEFADDFGVTISTEELQRRVRDMGTKRWLTHLSPPSSVLQSSKQTRLIAYAQNWGQTNNQLISFVSMMQFAIFYNRTLVIPLPQISYLQYMGFEHGLWDLQRLSQVVDFIFESQLPAKFRGRYFKYKEGLEDVVDKSDECAFDRSVSDQIPAEANEKCRMIFINGGKERMVHWQGADVSIDPWLYILPAPYIRNAAELWLMTTIFNSDSGNETHLTTNERRQRRRKRRFVAVHRRAMDEFHGKGFDNSDKYVCRRESKTLLSGWQHEHLRNWILEAISILVKAGHFNATSATSNKRLTNALFARVAQVYYHSCAMRLPDLNNILAMHKEAAVGGATDYPLFLAHDRQEPAVAARIIGEGRGVQQSAKFQFGWSHVDAAKRHLGRGASKQWLRAGECDARLFCANEAEVRGKETVLFDMWVLYYADFLVGSWMSTLSANVCKWRSRRLSMAAASHCFLEDKWRLTALALRNDPHSAANGVWFSVDQITTN